MNVEESEDCPLPPLPLPRPLTTIQLPTPNAWPGTSWTQEGGKTFAGGKYFIDMEFGYNRKWGLRQRVND